MNPRCAIHGCEPHDCFRDHWPNAYRGDTDRTDRWAGITPPRLHGQRARPGGADFTRYELDLDGPPTTNGNRP